jgi:predicted nucleic acid-binding protein
MSRLKAYVETTVLNRYFEDGREYADECRRFFELVADDEIEGYTSAAVLEEVDKAPSPKREEMLNLITTYNITVLELDQSAYDLADTYIEMGIIPARFKLDGIHIAMAAIHGMDCIVSLNFHHINKLKTKTATEIVHLMKGYMNPLICTPAEVIYDD